MKTTLQTIALATLCSLSALTVSSCGGGGSDSSSPSSDPDSSDNSSVSTLDSLKGVELESDLYYTDPQQGEAIISQLDFTSDTSVEYISLHYKAANGTAIKRIRANETQDTPCVYDAKTGTVVITIKDVDVQEEGSSAYETATGVLTLILHKTNDNTVQIEAGGQMVLEEGSDYNTYSIKSSQMQFEIN